MAAETCTECRPDETLFTMRYYIYHILDDAPLTFRESMSWNSSFRMVDCMPYCRSNEFDDVYNAYWYDLEVEDVVVVAVRCFVRIDMPNSWKDVPWFPNVLLTPNLI